MPSRPLDADTALSIKIGCVMTRNQFTKNPPPVLDELRATAGDRIDLLTEEVGMFIGFYAIPETAPLVEALREEFADLNLQPHIELAQTRRGSRGHSTSEFYREA